MRTAFSHYSYSRSKNLPKAQYYEKILQFLNDYQENLLTHHWLKIGHSSRRG